MCRGDLKGFTINKRLIIGIQLSNVSREDFEGLCSDLLARVKEPLVVALNKSGYCCLKCIHVHAYYNLLFVFRVKAGGHSLSRSCWRLYSYSGNKRHYIIFLSERN